MQRAIIKGLLMLALLGGAGAQETPPAAPPAAPAPPAVARAPRAARVMEYQYSTEGSGGSYLGVDTRDLTPERIAALKLKEEQGVEVTMVDQDAPAGKAGLKEHDVIASFNGEKVESVEQLRRLIRETPPGRSVALGILRDGQSMNFKVELADRRKMMTMMRPEREFRVQIPRISIPEIDIPSFTMLQYSRRNGVMVENLTPQLREYFGAKSGQGVLVRSVEKGSTGESAGLRAGDVVVRVGNEPVADMSDWNRLTRKSGGAVAVVVIRDHHEQNLSLNLPERKSDDSSDMHWYIPDGEIQQEVEHEMQNAQAEMARVHAKMKVDMERQHREMERLQREMMKQSVQEQ